MDYKFGIIRERLMGYGAWRAVAICSCGQHIVGGNYHQEDFECNKCGNDYFIKTGANGRFTIPYLEASRRDNRGFKVKRTNLSVEYDGQSVTPIKENLTRTMEYDIVDSVLKVWRGEEIEYDSSVDDGFKMKNTNALFFRQLDEKVFLEYLSNEVTRDLYQIARGLSDSQWGKKSNTLSGLKRLAEDNHKWLQILANAGIPEVSRFRRRSYYYGIRNNQYELATKETKPHKILNTPKFMMPYIREDTTIDYDLLKTLHNLFNKYDQNKLRDVMAIVKDEGTMRELANSIEDIMQIHTDYGYTNLNKLVLYIFREVRLTQGIERPSNASTYLRDYIRMSRSMGLEWEKYPKSLKKEHDVVQMNYNLISDTERQGKEFTLAIEKESYKSLEFGNNDKKQKYAIIVPETPEDLVREGNQLSHCVASYVKDVNNDRCKILFLRDKEEISKPIATIEVRGFNIRQARGFANRPVSQEQREFIKLWAEENNLKEAYY